MVLRWMRGETTTAGTRTPYRAKENPCWFSGEVALPSAGARRWRGPHVIIEPAVLVPGDDEHRVFPVGRTAHRLVDQLHQALAVAHVGEGVHAATAPVARGDVVAGLDEHVVGGEGGVLQVRGELVHVVDPQGADALERGHQREGAHRRRCGSAGPPRSPVEEGPVEKLEAGGLPFHELGHAGAVVEARGGGAMNEQPVGMVGPGIDACQRVAEGVGLRQGEEHWELARGVEALHHFARITGRRRSGHTSPTNPEPSMGGYGGA